MGVDEVLSRYFNETPNIILGTVSDDNIPRLRTLGSFAVDDLTVYFSTKKNTEKVKHILLNPSVSILFQHENQNVNSFVNVSIIGKARILKRKVDLEKAIKLLGERKPRFLERVEKGEMNDSIFIRVDPEEIRILDFGRGRGSEAVQVIRL